MHPLRGWSLYLFGSSVLASTMINLFMLPPLPVLTAWVGIFGALFVMAFPWYSNCIVRGPVIVFLRLLLCPSCLGVVDEGVGLSSGPAWKGGLLTKTRRDDTAATVQQALLRETFF